MNPNDLSKIRNEYRRGELDTGHVLPDPIHQFHAWMEDAIQARVEEPTAMTLATAPSDGFPSARMVLLKGADERGFVFFTNYRSRKAADLKSNPKASLVFYWQELERQVRVEGHIEKVSGGESDEYFALRPEESQVNAIISPQSTAVPDRKHLLDLRTAYLREHQGPHQRPEYWGGYRLQPVRIEFWQGREGRLHDRILYSRQDLSWRIERLAP